MFKLRKPFFVILLIICLNSINLFGQKRELFYENYNIDTAKIGVLYLNLDNVNFFINNEFASEKTISYTLPGYKLIPKLSFAVYDNILLEAGVSFLHYWGTNKYPMYSYLGISNWESNKYQNFYHFLPFFRAKANFGDNFHIVFGNLYNNRNHNLITPLYNPEFSFSSDEEMGVQTLFNSKYFDSDIWLNWQSFIFKNDYHQEVFTFGASTKTKLPIKNKNISFYLPIQFLAQHKGGGLDTNYNKNQLIENLAFGLGLSFCPKRILDKISFDVSYINSFQNSIEEIPFQKGYGLYHNLSIEKQNFNLRFAYWIGKDFFSIYGSEHFFNYSTTTKGMIFNDINLLHTHFGYLLTSKNRYLIGLDVDLYYYMPFDGCREGYGYIKSSDYVDFSFGIYLKINPEFRLKNIKNTN